MTVTSRPLAALALLTALAACGAGPRDRGLSRGRSRSDARADARAIEAAVTRYVAASNQGDIDALAALYAEDAVLLPPEHAPVQGRKAIADFWRQGTDHGLTIHTIRVDVQNDLGYLIGQYTLPATGQESADSGKYVLCLRRQRDGSWKVTADIWNSSVTDDPDDSDKGAPDDQPPSRWPVS
jgi:uncharacterized protein (TIGR02246 family)